MEHTYGIWQFQAVVHIRIWYTGRSRRSVHTEFDTDSMGAFCKYGNELTEFIKSGEFHDEVRAYQFPKEESCECNYSVIQLKYKNGCATSREINFVTVSSCHLELLWCSDGRLVYLSHSFTLWLLCRLRRVPTWQFIITQIRDTHEFTG
jgi:hypothetical protein